MNLLIISRFRNNKMQNNDSKQEFKLKPEQQRAYSLLVNGESMFITGPAGVGKTAVIKMFVDNYKRSGRKIAVTSTTGTSALLLGGTTMHSYLSIGLGKGTVEEMVNKLKKVKYYREKWTKLDCLIIDEISMLHPDLFDKLENVARVIRGNDKPFGGIQIVLSGDFLQLPCIGTNRFCFDAKSWDRSIPNIVYLDEIVRQGDTRFQDLLNNIRVGKLTKKNKKQLKARLNAELTNDFGITPTKLYSKNVNVDIVNEHELDILAEDDRQFREFVMDVNVSAGVKYKDSAERKFIKNCIAPEVLQICVDAQVMLLKNLDLAMGLANGSRGVVTGFNGDMPVVKFLNGVELEIEYATWEVSEKGKVLIQARQLPLKIAYAITIHKSQGCSLDYAEIDLCGVFEYGQAYVALSRVKSFEGMSIIGIEFHKIQANPDAVRFYEMLAAKKLLESE